MVCNPDPSQDKASIPPAAEIAACCQLTAESLFWNFTQLNKTALPKNSPTSNYWSMWAYKGLASLPQFRITLKVPLTPNLCAFSQSSIAAASQLNFSSAKPGFPHFLIDVVPESLLQQISCTQVSISKSVSQGTKLKTPQTLAQYLVHNRLSITIW